MEDIKRIVLNICVSCFVVSPAFAGEWSGNIALEGRYFLSEPAFVGQDKNGGFSVGFEPEYKHQWDNDNQQLTFTPFLRWDEADEERTHVDIRQLDYLKAKGDWEFQIGIGKKFWGVTESGHLVDIINQTDGVEGADGEDKLGQPMLRASRLLENGSVDFFALPYFRERTFPSISGRLRTALVVDADATTFESSKKEKHLDYAIRWSHTQDTIDLGLSYFDGTSREPSFNVGMKNGSETLIPHYAQIQQLGLDLQQTGEETIWKLEAVHRRSKQENYTAMIGGFEHTLPWFNLVGEYHFDTRGEVQSAPFQNDLFVGARIALDDEASSELLAGTFYDLDNGSASIRLEGSRRIRDGLKLNLEAQWMTNVHANDPLHTLSKDDFIKFELQKFF